MIKRKCLVCGKTIWIKKSHIKRGWGKYCSKECQAKIQIKGQRLNCDYCGKKIWRTPKDFKRSKSKNFFVPLSVTVHGRMKIDAVAGMHLIGQPVRLSIGDY